MLARCNNPRHQEFCRYGARGIYVCDEWLDFWSFVSWVESTYEVEKTIDRIDNDGPYSPTNCRWATAKEQQANARITESKIRSITNAREMHRQMGWAGNTRKRNSRGNFVSNS